MRPSFNPRTVNGPFEDPALFIPFSYQNRAVLFDIGDIHSLSSRDILKVSHAFVSHTHMDHFIGFDHLLRLFLGRQKNLHLYGPELFLTQIEGKLQGYSWNLVKHYTNQLTLSATEVRPDRLVTRQYCCTDGFVPVAEDVASPFDGVLLDEPPLSVSAVILDHSIPCLGFTIRERFHINVMKDALDQLGLETGPWINRFKQALYTDADPESEFEVQYRPGITHKQKFLLGELTNRIARITPGQKVTYIADVVYSESNIEKIIDFAKGADQLFIEAAFIEKDKKMAKDKFHLTARQAGILAGRASVKNFTLFHFSPRYQDNDNSLNEEAHKAFKENFNPHRSVVEGI